jgi:hypothetical protein
MSHNPPDVRVNHENAGHQASGEVSLHQGSVVENPRTHSETGNEANPRRYRFAHHCEANFSASLGLLGFSAINPIGLRLNYTTIPILQVQEVANEPRLVRHDGDRPFLGASANECEDLQNSGNAGAAHLPTHHMDRFTDQGCNPRSIPIHQYGVGFVFWAVYLNKFVRERKDSPLPDLPATGRSRSRRQRQVKPLPSSVFDH